MADIKKLVQDKDAEVATYVAKLIITLAVDIVKVVYTGAGAVAGFIADLVTADTSSGVDTSLPDKVNELVDAVNRLKQEFADAYFLIQFQAIDDQMAGAIAQWKNLFRPDGTVDDTQAPDDLTPCETTLQSLGPLYSEDPAQNLHWLADYQLMQDVLYSRVPLFGVGSGAYDELDQPETVPPANGDFHFVAPTPISSGSAEGWMLPAPEASDPQHAFNHVYVLPNFLQAISIYLAVGTVRLSGFPQARATMIRSYAQFLVNVHDRIANDGLVLLSPPSPAEIYSVYNVQYQRPDLGVLGVDRDGNLAGGEWRDYSRYQPFGAVELYSGTEAILSYPRIQYSPGDFVLFPANELDGTRTLQGWKPQKLSADWLRLFYGKYRLRSLACGKVLYQKLGLDQVRIAVNGLSASIGDPPLFVGASFGDWSIREAFTALNDPALPLSVRALIGSVRSAAPADPNVVPGLRAVLGGDVAAQLAAS